jgi:tetratricopeptide (TPR) repeat protein
VLYSRRGEETLSRSLLFPRRRSPAPLRRCAAFVRGSAVLDSFSSARSRANGLNFDNYGGGLHSAYVRGEALMAARRHAEAAAELQKVLDYPGIVGTDPIGVLAHLQLGRVFVLSGDRTKAKAAYETSLALWKDADADIPVLKRAKAEYARLQPAHQR